MCGVYLHSCTSVDVCVHVKTFHGLMNVCYNASLLSIATGIDSMRTIILFTCKIPYCGFCVHRLLQRIV